ncbi:uncharacterized protein LOC142351483 [Convolutriloba macropyga]|uniref:uncharacterized protein LOC142351483 n=1 Tax=Convolutriloba macropyga TaxID=536237 RepID=UPI003F525FD4
MSKSKSGKKDGGAAKGPAVPPEDEEGYSNFSVQDDLTNVILIVEGKKLYVHRDVLVVNCPGLKDKIAEASQGGTDQQQQEEGGETARDQIASPRVGDPENPVEVTLQDVQCEDVRELMKCIYPKHKPVTDENVDMLVPLVGEWEVESVKEQCESVLMAREPPSLKLLLQAQECKLDNAADFFAKKLAEENSIGDLQKQQEDFEKLNFAYQSKLYRYRILHLEDEQKKLDDTATLLYPLTKFTPYMHKCLSVSEDRYGYLVITTTQDDGKKKREKLDNSALVYYNEVNPKCKDCVFQYGQLCRDELCKLENAGAFDHVKKKFESEKKGKAKPAKK